MERLLLSPSFSLHLNLVTLLWKLLNFYINWWTKWIWYPLILSKVEGITSCLDIAYVAWIKALSLQIVLQIVHLVQNSNILSRKIPNGSGNFRSLDWAHDLIHRVTQVECVKEDFKGGWPTSERGSYSSCIYDRKRDLIGGCGGVTENLENISGLTTPSEVLSSAIEQGSLGVWF